MITFKSVNKIVEFLNDQSPDTFMIDGYEGALLGVVENFHGYVCVYDKEKILRSLRNDGLSHDEAEEYFDFNIRGAYMGELSPTYIIGMTGMKRNTKRKKNKENPKKNQVANVSRNRLTTVE